jgi:hypothetical protein
MRSPLAVSIALLLDSAAAVHAQLAESRVRSMRRNHE